MKFFKWQSRWLKVRLLERVSGKVIVDEEGIKDTWKEYMEKLMNEENEWDHSISAGVKRDQQIVSRLLK